MSALLTGLALKEDIPNCCTKLVLICLTDCANEEGKCWPSIATIAKRAGCSERTVQRHLGELVEKGYVSRQHREGTTPFYYVHIGGDRMTGVTQPCHQGGDTAMSPKPSLNRQRTLSVPTRLPDMLDLDLDPLLKEGFSDDEANHEALQFRDYHKARGNKFKDWNAAWRTWCRNALKFKRTDKVRRSPAAHTGRYSIAAELDR